MIRTATRGKKALVTGLVVGALACASAAAAMPSYSVLLRARLGPPAGNAAGQFNGTLLVNAGGETAFEPVGSRSVLAWKLSLRGLQGPMSASLQLDATKSAPITLTLCAHCTAAASGRMLLTRAQAFRLARPDAVIVVHTSSTTLRGPVKAYVRVAAASARS
ncbi:MAG TPA: hypothetical protein VKE27_04360 [Candidatus Dormibacteraeota bacterium]|nr:hypothetical protein [Candidatus Dormibacteraeota bacterium]